MTVGAGLGVLLLAYLLALDLAELVERADSGLAQLTAGWAAAVALPVAAGLGGCALALAVVAVPVSPSLPLLSPAAVVALSVLAMRRRGAQ